MDAFDTLTNSGAVNPQTADEQLFTDVFGWWPWINNNSKLVLLAHDAGLGHEALPSTRSILEHAVVMHGVIDDPEAATAAITGPAGESEEKPASRFWLREWVVGLRKPCDADVPSPLEARATGGRRQHRVNDEPLLPGPGRRSAARCPCPQGQLRYIGKRAHRGLTERGPERAARSFTSLVRRAVR
jgi:hypothetical protein